MTERKKNRKARHIAQAICAFLFFLLTIIAPLENAAHAVEIKKNWGGAIKSEFKQRWGKGHKGVDYGTSCGTTVQTNGPVTCHLQGEGYKGWGSYALVQLGCGVEELYAHLEKCTSGSTSVVTGGAPGAKGSGNSRGCHLHYEVRINKCHVNPESAFNKDLCLEATKKPLLDEAKAKLGKFATCSAGGGGDQVDTGPGPKPPGGDPGYKEIIYVPGTPGEFGRWEIETFDGRRITIPDMRIDDNPHPPLPPTTDDLVPDGQSDNEITGCATDTWRAMVNQSVLQARREIMFNNHFIAKGDSVMAYSCFEESALKVGEELGPIFSESKRWVNKQVDISSAKPSISVYYPPVVERIVTLNKELGETSLDGAINTTARHNYENWILSNFGHGFLGGKLPASGSGDEESSMAQAYMPCGVMNQIWQLAKCSNFDQDPPFPRFEELIQPDSDPRIYPGNMKCKNTGITQRMIDRAKQKEVDNSKLDPYIKMIYPDGGKCHTPIKTGIIVERREGIGPISRKITYEDGACVTVGCSYDRGGQCQ